MIEFINEIQKGGNEMTVKTIELEIECAKNIENFNPCVDVDYDKIDALMDESILLATNIKTKLDAFRKFSKNTAITKILEKNFMQYFNNFHTRINYYKTQLIYQATYRIIKYTKSNGESLSFFEGQDIAEQIIENGSDDRLFIHDKYLLSQLLDTRQIILRIDLNIKTMNRIIGDIQFFIARH